MHKAPIHIIKSGLLQSITHGFFTRNGGVSKGDYESLNCSMKETMDEPHTDSSENVLINRALAMGALGVSAESLLTVRQVHGATAIFVTQPWEESPRADAMLTKRRDVTLAVQTADCVPVLFLDTENEIIGVIHAGWKGALAGIIESTLDVLLEIGGDPLTTLAAIGPCVSQKFFEVGPEVEEAFLEKHPENKQFFKKDADSLFFDLSGYVKHILEKACVKEVEVLPYDTYHQEDQFFSCRRSTHRKENFGGQLSAISFLNT